MRDDRAMTVAQLVDEISNVLVVLEPWTDILVNYASQPGTARTRPISSPARWRTPWSRWGSLPPLRPEHRSAGGRHPALLLHEVDWRRGSHAGSNAGGHEEGLPTPRWHTSCDLAGERGTLSRSGAFPPETSPRRHPGGAFSSLTGTPSVIPSPSSSLSRVHRRQTTCKTPAVALRQSSPPDDLPGGALRRDTPAPAPKGPLIWRRRAGLQDGPGHLA